MKPFALALLALFFCRFLSGCASTEEADRLAETVRQNEALHEQNTRLTSELAAKDALSAKLRITLLEKDAEIGRLTALQHERERENTQRKSKTQPPKNKAEAVALLAEAEADLNALHALAGNDEEKRACTRSAQLLADGRAELGRGNFAKAAALADEVQEQVRSLQAKKAAQFHAAPVTSFVPPMRMQVAKKGKVRSHPGPHSRMVQVLEPGTLVTATAYQGHWVKITVGDRPSGWIHYSLLVVPER